MMTIPNTVGHQIATKYLQSALGLKPDDFYKLLASNVVMTHETNEKNM